MEYKYLHFFVHRWSVFWTLFSAVSLQQKHKFLYAYTNASDSIVVVSPHILSLLVPVLNPGIGTFLSETNFSIITYYFV